MDGAGREAVVDPEITRREVIARVASGEYKNISFIHEIADAAVGRYYRREFWRRRHVPEIAVTGADLQADRFDHARDLRKQRGRVREMKRHFDRQFSTPLGAEMARPHSQ
jgi:hypothetical protein